MDQEEVSTNGSPAPNNNAGTTNDLWEQVAACQSVKNAELSGSTQASAGNAATAPSNPAVVADVAAQAITALDDGDDVGNTTQRPTVDSGVSAATIATTGTDAVIGTTNPDSSGLAQFVKTYPLDRAKRLNPKGFPHPPKGESAQVITTFSNVQYLLDMNGIAPTYCVIKKKLYIPIPGHVGSADNYDNVALAHITSLATLNGMSSGAIPGLLAAIGDRYLRNPAKEWIESKPWDGVERFEAFAKTLQERKGYPPFMKKLLLRKFLRSMVAAANMSRGFRCRGVLVLQGKQSIGKGAWIQAIVSDPVLSELLILLGHSLDPANKDSVLKAVSHWLVELAELDSTFKRDIGRIKGFLTSGSDRIRRPYARLESEFARHTVFCASVNDANFLVDETGNSRFWTIAVESVNYQHGIDMQQLFAEIAVEFEAGEQWWLTPDEEMQLAEVNNDHRVVSLVRERVMAAIAFDPPTEGQTTALSAIEMLERAGIDRPTNPQCKECAAILREVYGDPKKVRGRYVWRLVLADKALLGGDETSAAVDDDDQY